LTTCTPWSGARECVVRAPSLLRALAIDVRARPSRRRGPHLTPSNLAMLAAQNHLALLVSPRPYPLCISRRHAALPPVATSAGTCAAALPLSPLPPKASPWPRRNTPPAPIKSMLELPHARLLPWRAQTAVAHHGCRRRELPLFSRTRQRLSGPPPPQDLPGAPRVVTRAPSSFCSPAQGKPRTPSTCAAARPQPAPLDPNRPPTPTLGEPLVLFRPLPDLELRRGRRNSIGSAAPAPWTTLLRCRKMQGPERKR
jgi:hypothetical protein